MPVSKFNHKCNICGRVWGHSDCQTDYNDMLSSCWECKPDSPSLRQRFDLAFLNSGSTKGIDGYFE